MPPVPTISLQVFRFGINDAVGINIPTSRLSIQDGKCVPSLSFYEGRYSFWRSN
jgi:hypothetical protein